MSQWTSICTHAHTDYGYSSSVKVVKYATSGTSLRKCVHVAMVPKHAAGTPNVSKLQDLAKCHGEALKVVIYDTDNEEGMTTCVADIITEAGSSGINLVYTCPDYCEEGMSSGLTDVSQDQLYRTFHHNCVIPVFLSRLFYPALQAASCANAEQPLNRRRAALVHVIGERGVLGDFFGGSRGGMYGYSASLAAMIMSMKTMSYEFNKRGDGILCFGVITPSPHTSRDYDVTFTRDKISDVVHGATAEHHGKCLDVNGRDVSY